MGSGIVCDITLIQRKHVAKPNYQYEKRQRELEKKKKKAEKAQRKASSSDAPAGDGPLSDDLDSPQSTPTHPPSEPA